MCREAVVVVGGCHVWPCGVLGGSIVLKQIVGCCLIARVLVSSHCILVGEVSDNCDILGWVFASHEGDGEYLKVSSVVLVLFGEVPTILVFGRDELVIGSNAAALLGDCDRPRSEIITV